MPYLLEQGSGLAFLQYSAVRRLANDHELQISQLRFSTAPVHQAFWWHPTLDENSGQIWMKGVLRETARVLALAT